MTVGEDDADRRGEMGQTCGVVVDADELGFEAIVAVIVGLGIGVLIGGAVIAILLGRQGGRPFGAGPFGLGLVITVAAVVVAVVVARTVTGDVTGWDAVWAVGLAAAATWATTRLLRPPGGSPPP